MNIWMKTTVGAIALAAAGVANASITYTVNQTIGGGGVTGTITTDGTLGLLTVSNFTGWNLNLNGVGASFNVNDGNSVVLSYVTGFFGPPNSDVTATANNIFFNFDGLDGGYLGFQQGAYSGQHYWCLATVTQGFDCLAGGQTVAPISFFDPSTQFQAYHGNQIIASVAGGVPEPASWALMTAGFGLVGAGVRRRAKVTITYA